MKTKLLTIAILSSAFVSGCRHKGGPVEPCGCDSTSSVPTQGLIAYYPFDGNANDLSGNNYHGEISGATVTKDRFGKSNSALIFDGVDDFVGVYNITGSKLEPKNAITISCFIYPTSSRGNEPWSRIIRKAADFNNGYVLGWNHDNNMQLESFLIHNATPDIYRTPADRVGLSNITLIGSWHQVAMTYSKNTRVSKLYLDGILVDSKANCNYNFEHTSEKMGIGGSAGNITSDGIFRYESFPGAIDDVRIYDRALSDEEILALYYEKGYKK